MTDLLDTPVAAHPPAGAGRRTPDMVPGRVGVIGSRSSTSRVHVSLTRDADEQGLVGSMVVVRKDFPSGDTELGLGVVEDVETRNAAHEQIATVGMVTNLVSLERSPGGADVLQAVVDVQAVYQRDVDGQVTPKGSALSTSPRTGTIVDRLGEADLTDIADAAGGASVYALGDIYRMPGLPLPMNTDHYDTPMGSSHAGFFGTSGSGKALALNTPIPTPSGWVAMGDLADGDTVFDETGRPCHVVKAHEVMHGRPCFEVEFSDGSTIVADADHLWYVETRASRVSLNRQRTLAERRTRAGVLSADVVARLRNLAEGAVDGDTITLAEAAVLIGRGPQADVFVKACGRAVGPSGATTIFVEQEYAAQTVVRTRPCRTWPGRDLYDALAGRLEQRGVLGGSSSAARLRAADPPARVAMADIAAVLGRSQPNGGLRRHVDLTGVPSRIEPREYVTVLDGYTRTTPKPGVATYSTRALLTELARRGERPRNDQRAKQVLGRVLTTSEAAEAIASGDVLSVPVAEGLALPEANLPVPPYTFGAWLGDGGASGGGITTADPEIVMYVEGDGYSTRLRPSSVREGNAAVTHGVLGLMTGLRSAGLRAPGSKKATKVIPDAYLFASESQRRDLLAGLLDTDGNACEGSAVVEFSNTNERLARDVFRLAASLGYRPTLRSKTATLDGRDCGIAYTVGFSTDDDVFRLPRKALDHKRNRVNYTPALNEQRYITAIRPVESVPVRCITVDSPSHLFLAGDAMIPTHNTILASYFTAAQMRHDDLGVLVIDPQGQFTTEQGMEFSLQGFASGLGRQVKVASLLGEVQLDKNKDLFARLLGKTKFFTPYLFTQNNDNVGHAVEQVKKALDQVGADGNDWTTTGPGALLEAILDRFEAAVPFIYSSESAAENFRAKIELHRTDLHTGDGSSCDLLPSLRAVLGLFRPGRGKVAEKNLFSHLFARNPGLPRGMVVLNMVPEDPSMDIDMRERLGGDDTKALLLGHLMHRLEKEAERRFQTPTIDPETGRPRLLNTMVLFDEAARYAPRQPDNDDVARLAKSLSRYAKEMRKYGVGFNYILQEPKDLDLGVWTQLSSGFRIIGYGLGGASMSMVKEYLPSEGKDSGRLYRSFPSPRSTGEFNFMVLGGVSPLSMSNAPLYLSAFTSFEQFADANPWIRQSAITGATSGPAGGKPAPVEAAAPDDDDAFDDLGDDPLPF